MNAEDKLMVASRDFTAAVNQRNEALERIAEHEEYALEQSTLAIRHLSEWIQATTKAKDEYKRLALLVMLTYLMIFGVPAYAINAQGNPQQVEIGVQVVQGISAVFPNVLYNYTEPTSTTCQYAFSTEISIPANTSNFAINTATLFPAFTTPVLFGVAEVTQPSVNVNIGLSSSGPTLNLNTQGFLLARVGSGSPTFYVSNPSATSAALVQVFALGN